MKSKIVKKKEIAEILGVKLRQITNYVKEGMPVHSIGARNAQMFDAEVCKAWKDNQKKPSPVSIPKSEVEIDIGDDNKDAQDSKTNDMLRKLKADADKAEEDAVLARLKKEKEQGLLIESKDLDIAQAEQAVIYQTNYMNDKKLFPVELYGKSKNEMRMYLDGHYAKRMEDLDTLVNKEFESDESLFEIVEVVLEKLKDGVEPSSLIKRLNGSLI